MATPRKHWFYVADALVRAGLTNDELATRIRLMGWMNTRRAREKLNADEASRAFIPIGDCMTITGAAKGTTAYQRLIRCGNGTDTLTVLRGTRDGTRTGTAGVFVEWGNLPIFQGWASPKSGGPGAHGRKVDAPSDSDSDLRLRSPKEDKSPTASRSGESVPSEASEKRPAKTRKPPAEWARWVAALLAQELRKRQPGARVPANLDGWSREIARIDAEPGAVAAAVRWLYSEANEGDYRIEVQSGAALREKYGRVLAQIERKRRESPRPASSRPFAGSMGNGVDEARAQVEAEIAAHAKHRQPDPSCTRCKFGAVLEPLLRSVS